MGGDIASAAMPPIEYMLVIGAVVIVGAAVQSSVGLGLGLIAAPVVSFIDPSLMPGSLLITTGLLPLLTVASEWRHIDWRGLAWGLPARVPGSLIGAWVVAALEPRMLGAAVGAMVLVAVGLSLLPLTVRPAPAPLLAAGLTSGAMGTATSIGGPPIALVYQNEEGPRVRATLGAFFLFGIAISLTVLTASGQLDRHQVTTGLAMLPCIVAGFLLGRPLRRLVDAGLLRAALLAVVACSGAALVVRSFL
ncbi:sulfite exporter TauE/SafE family protein [Nocardiopsis composta]